jgi:AcrR family transcriptional regulator
MADDSRKKPAAAVGEKQAAKKAAIVDAAAELFAESSIKKTSVAKVMDRAGMTRELFYYYFSGKEELVSCVIDKYVQETLNLIDDRLAHAAQVADSDASPEVQMAHVAAIVRYLFADRDGERVDRVRVVGESGHAIDAMQRVVSHLASELRNADAYAHYVCTCGEMSQYHTELVMYGMGGTILAHPELSDEEVAAVACTAGRLA